MTKRIATKVALAFLIVVAAACQGEETTVIIDGTPVKVSLPTATAIAKQAAAAAQVAREPFLVKYIGGTGDCTIDPKAWPLAQVLRWEFHPKRDPVLTDSIIATRTAALPAGQSLYLGLPTAAFRITRISGDSSELVYEYTVGDQGAGGQITITDRFAKYVISATSGSWAYALAPSDGRPQRQTYDDNMLGADDTRAARARRLYCATS